MKAQELRIGNYLRKLDWVERANFHNKDSDEADKLHETDLYGEVWGMNKHDDRIEFSWDIPYMCNVTDNVNLSDLEPIPITEEWLKKFGFKKDDFLFKKTRTWQSRFSSDRLESTFEIVNDLIEGNKLIYKETFIYHVHQLQNLYHELTGEELQLKHDH